MKPTTERCAGCGAVQEPGASCQECFDALLAFEYENPVAFGPVHHLTVASFYLQHPRGHAIAALDGWRDVLSQSLEANRAPRDILAEMRERFDGAKRVRDASAVTPEWWPREWPMTIRDVFDPTRPPPAVEEYVTRARAWAASVRRSLDERADPAARTAGRNSATR